MQYLAEQTILFVILQNLNNKFNWNFTIHTSSFPNGERIWLWTYSPRDNGATKDDFDKAGNLTEEEPNTSGIEWPVFGGLRFQNALSLLNIMGVIWCKFMAFQFN